MLKKVLSFYPKSTIVFIKKYYRFCRKVLSFLLKGTIVFTERCYRLAGKDVTLSLV